VRGAIVFTMNIWLIFAVILLLGMIPCLVVCIRQQVMERFIAIQTVQLLVILILLLSAKGFGKSICYDVAVLASVLTIGWGLVYARLLGRWL